MIPMRSHGGGWHANTAKMCFGLSIIYYLTVVFVSERLSDTFDNLWFMALISAIIILLSPVDSINKPLDGEQRKIEKKKACRYIVAIYSISLILKWNSLTCYVKEINFALFIVLCSMIFGIVSNTKSNRKQDV
nr:accessory gene regulator B family protein [Clostridium sp. AM49-4BH]